MSKLFKQLGRGSGAPVKKCGGEAFRSDRVRTYVIDESSKVVSSGTGLSANAGYESDTTGSGSSFSSLLSAAAQDDLPPPPSPWMQSLAAHNAEDQRCQLNQVVDFTVGSVQDDEPSSHEVFHTAPKDLQHNPSQPIYENQEIINRLSHASSGGCDEEVRDISGRTTQAGYERFAERNKVDRDPYMPLRESGGQGNMQLEPHSGVLSMQSGNYEQPWNLEAAQCDVKDQFDGVLIGQLLQRNKLESAASRSSAQMSNGSPLISAHKDSRPQEGYEKPWDWKPHQRDNRGREGYDRPWDLKPHLKDDRPAGEYDEPWNKRLKDIESNLIAAKISKETGVIIQKYPEGVYENVPAAVDPRGQDGYEKPWDLKPHQRDDRPADEYDQPWHVKSKEVECDVVAAKMAKEAAKLADGIEQRRELRDGVRIEEGNKSRLISNGRAMSANCDAPPHAGVANHGQAFISGDHNGRHLPSDVAMGRNHQRWSSENCQQEKEKVTRRISSGSSVVDQIWYHGAIGRSDAELVMQGTREGSYLVRQGEINSNDFSLSVKSQAGVVHMKIVVDKDGRYILGQFSKPFASITNMIQHYTISKLPIKGAEHISLVHPIPTDIL